MLTIPNVFRKLPVVKIRKDIGFSYKYLLGLTGILLIPIDSFPYFPIATANRPIWILPFILLFFIHVLFKEKVPRHIVIFFVAVIAIVTKSFFLYNLYNYPDYSGLVKGAFVLFAAVLTIGGVSYFILYLRSVYGSNYLSKLAEMLLMSAVLPCFLGVLQLLNILGIQPFATLAKPVTLLFSVRFNSEARLQLTTGEPSWASAYLIFLFIFVLLFYNGRFKRIYLFVIFLFFLLTGSSLGFIYALACLFIYVFFFIKPKYLVRALLACIIFAVLAVQLYAYLPVYTRGKIDLVLHLISTLSVEQILLIASYDWSFLARFLNPVLGFKVGFSSFLFGIGIDAFQYHIIDELVQLNFLGSLTEGQINGLLNSGGTPKFLFSKVFCELGFLWFCALVGYYVWLIARNSDKKRIVFLVISSVVLVFNFDSYLYYVPILFLLIAQHEIAGFERSPSHAAS